MKNARRTAQSEEISRLREMQIQMEVDFNRERGERLISEIILCTLLFAAGVIIGFYLR
jgi:hypothetical protein